MKTESAALKRVTFIKFKKYMRNKSEGQRNE